MRDHFHREKFKAYLIDTSCYGNVFYLNYHRWIAVAKETFLINKVEGFSNLFKEKGIKLLVLESSLKIYKETKLHEEIEILIECIILKKLKAHLHYIILNCEGERAAEAENKIAFTNTNGELISVPLEIYRAFYHIKPNP